MLTLADGLLNILFYIQAWPICPSSFSLSMSFQFLINLEGTKLQELVRFPLFIGLATWNTAL